MFVHREYTTLHLSQTVRSPCSTVDVSGDIPQFSLSSRVSPDLLTNHTVTLTQRRLPLTP